MSAGSITGVVGLIKWSYYNAAAINGYTVSRVDASWSLRGNVVQADAFKLAQRPLFFVAPHEKGEWRWPIRSFELQHGALTAVLGPPLESRDGVAVRIRRNGDVADFQR